MNKLEFNELISKQAVILDGAMGTELQKRGFLNDAGSPEELNITSPEKIQVIHRDYLEAGSNIILANTFGANRLKLKDYNLTDKLVEINQKGISNARFEADKYNSLVAGDIGPLGSYLTPLGPLTFDDAYEVFSEQVKALACANPDLLFIETMADIREVKSALLAVKDNYSGPVIVQMTFSGDGTTVTGTDVLTFLSVVQGMGADGVGLNCSVGPKDLLKLARILTENTHLPISFKPNAGMPTLINRETVFPGTVEEFVEVSTQAFNAGINMLGGCCGTNPDFIRALSQALKNKIPVKRERKNAFFLSSRTKTINLSSLDKFIVVGERINPTGRKRFQDELYSGNFSTIRREAKMQVEAGADILDINMGLPGADEADLLKKAVGEIQESVSVPLCLDSSSAEALEAGLKAYTGKPIINSVNGDKEKLDKILPLAKRYGAAVVGLTTDESGLPKTAEKRLQIADTIITAAKKAGLPESEVILDFLTLSVSAMPGQTNETLQAIKLAKDKWPLVKTILGVSNVSFGMPNRYILNSTFLHLAKSSGLSMGILNPHEDWSVDDKLSKDFLLGNDPNGEKYINAFGKVTRKTAVSQQTELTPSDKLYNAVVDGNREEINKIIQEAVSQNISPLEISNSILIRALNDVGGKFNRKEFFLPQVIRSAEAAQAAFSFVKPLLKKNPSFKPVKILLATVKGDVHDIGKNIVSAVFESHGWEVIDLGKNVESERIIETAADLKCPLIGLSALMTTTMPEMEKVVRLKCSSNLPSKILIGGAPVTKKYSNEIGADGYASNAVEAVEVAKLLIEPQTR